MTDYERDERAGRRGPLQLAPGHRAPRFSLLDQNEKPVRLTDFAGKKLLVYFYPKADTPGCTAQACSVRDALGDLKKRGLAVVGISPDKVGAQKHFDDKHRLRFPLLSDTSHTAAKAYGAWGRKSMYGKKYMGIIRSAFLIDERGNILNAWYKIAPKDMMSEALKAVKVAPGGEKRPRISHTARRPIV